MIKDVLHVLVRVCTLTVWSWLEPSQREEFPISAKLNVHSSVAIAEGIEQHRCKQDGEQGQGENAALRHSVAHLEGVRGVIVL